jgi:hypothetical protein
MEITAKKPLPRKIDLLIALPSSTLRPPTDTARRTAQRKRQNRAAMLAT